jgi:hypothetical protein
MWQTFTPNTRFTQSQLTCEADVSDVGEQVHPRRRGPQFVAQSERIGAAHVGDHVVDRVCHCVHGVDWKIDKIILFLKLCIYGSQAKKSWWFLFTSCFGTFYFQMFCSS